MVHAATHTSQPRLAISGNRRFDFFSALPLDIAGCAGATTNIDFIIAFRVAA